VSLVTSIWNKYTPARQTDDVGLEDDVDESQSGTESGTATPTTEGESNGKPRRVAATTMAGGRRRKAVRKK
jgi:hypothetical protein